MSKDSIEYLVLRSYLLFSLLLLIFSPSFLLFLFYFLLSLSTLIFISPLNQYFYYFYLFHRLTFIVIFHSLLIIVFSSSFNPFSVHTLFSPSLSQLFTISLYGPSSPFYLPSYFLTYLPNYLSTYLRTYSPAYLPNNLPTYPPTYPSNYLFLLSFPSLSHFLSPIHHPTLSLHSIRRLDHGYECLFLLRYLMALRAKVDLNLFQTVTKAIAFTSTKNFDQIPLMRDVASRFCNPGKMRLSFTLFILFVCFSLFITYYLSIDRSIYLSIYLNHHLFFSPYVSLSLSLSLSLFFFFLFSLYISLFLSLTLSFFLSVYICMTLSLTLSFSSIPYSFILVQYLSVTFSCKLLIMKAVRLIMLLSRAACKYWEEIC